MNKNKTFLDENGKIVFSKFSGLESKLSNYFIKTSKNTGSEIFWMSYKAEFLNISLY